MSAQNCIQILIFKMLFNKIFLLFCQYALYKGVGEMKDNSKWLSYLILRTENRLSKKQTIWSKFVGYTVTQEVFWFTGMIISIIGIVWALRTMGFWFNEG